MPTKDIIAIGSSAGGIDALTRLCAGLPADLPASVFIAQHISPTSRSVLPQLLARAGPLPASSPVDGQRFERGHIYVAPPDHHLLLREGRLLIRRGPYENRTRPAVNALFRSAAVAYGARVIGVVLTGLLDDGTEGLIAIKAAGGTSVVQDPDDAEWPSMPRNAVMRDHVDRVAPLAALPALLAELAASEAGPTIPLPSDYRTEDRIAAQEFAVTETEIETPGTPSHLSCPDCGGVLNQIEAEHEVRFRCQVGHAFTPLGLADAQSEELERALSIAVRTHRDRLRLFEQMHDSAEARGLSHASRRWRLAREESAQMLAALEQATSVLRKPRADGEA
ncbi:chemotaxis protein CheB [Sphingomonas corticis]|jgi:two-component system chemotaxis response regulator CheB|uniref:protein-glutamate methylesterase n=1 Tax=Sphingomonas corticis TaxID=2722791 RepID=A0ABX1CR03_9SPHN|nr:chemotaxis protein CheB [Sphingomonas corticis]NJR80382.1 chemotaxis protein CheB [Sphingomonas corticis]